MIQFTWVDNMALSANVKYNQGFQTLVCRALALVTNSATPLPAWTIPFTSEVETPCPIPTAKTLKSQT